MSAPHTFAQRYLGTFLRPGRTFEALSEHRALRSAIGAVLSAAMVYSAFVLWMYATGHQPSFTGNPIPAEHYYLWQAIFLPPWLLVAWAAYASAAHGLSRLFGSTATWPATAAPLGFALAVPLTWSYLIPEMLVFGLAGHGALVTAMRITGPLTLIWWSVLTWKALRSTHEQSRLASAAITFVALLALIAVTAVLVR
ncbi:hypothetical protein FIV42_07455 [Persicimonas caeni]|uniref:Yip1 domain-containing protein n=1 Tax=Persicimonas caeni TaxID=2292766 RepID=A0A4Y6PS11_PERCE|nr:YIP1 family protein [Persicimonas caeni]QDG50575.1 hypothetical protein FIV42_07455 [Persicimonas caeni]QED31796.1 hypothetical protein FRD00_07450 [Persicimonas caeni]